MNHLLQCSWAGVLLAASSSLAADAFQSLDLGTVKVGGEIGRRISVTVENNLLALDADKDFLAPFQAPAETRTGAYIGLGKLIDCAVRLAVYTGDERVKARKQHLVRAAIAAQEPDGYIGTFPPAKRMWSLWDIHEMGYLVYGLTMDHRYFGEEKSLAAARKLADYILANWAAHPPTEPSPWDITLHMGVTGIENALLALHGETGDSKYLDFVTKTRRLPEWNARIVTGRWGPIEGHAYAHLCRCIGQLRLHRLQADDRLLKPSHDAMDFIRRDGMTIAGEIGDHECWHDTQEGTVNLGESCATAYLVRWLDELLRMEGESYYGDLMERAVLNGLFAAQSPDGRRIRYYTPMEGPRDYHKGDTYCCPNNYRRAVAELPQYIYYKTGDAVMVNLYGASEARLQLKPGLSVGLKQETDFPNSGRIALKVEPSQAAEFTVKLRMPRWCRQPSVTVQGQSVAAPPKPGAFFAITRKWSPGDVVAIDLPMSWQLVKGRVAQAGRVAMMRGPMVFALNRTRHKSLNQVDLRLLILDTRQIEGPVADNSVRPSGMACRVKAWGPGDWYPAGRPRFELELTEFADPGIESTYLKVPNPNDAKLVDDELLGVRQ